MPERFDLIVIGSGSAAREAAARATTDHGAHVAVIERERWGGQCPNVACKPTKHYLAAAELLRDLRAAAPDLGIDAPLAGFSLEQLKARKDWLVGTQEAWRQRFVDAGHEAVDGEARFLDARTVAVAGRDLSADRILVATGSRTALPPVEGIEDVPWLDHVSALELTEVPSSLLVLGAGPVGLELAQCFARFGSRVTLVQSDERIAARSDAEAAAELSAALAEELELVTSTHLTAIARDGERLVATLSPRDGSAPRTLGVDALLLASGRRPNVEPLDLEAAGVAHGRGGIHVDERLRTNVPGIWAAGDVTDRPQLTPVAVEQAQVAVGDMFGGGRRAIDYDVIPTSIFTDPELASVGLTEREARERGHDVASQTYRADALAKPYYVSAERGLVKLVYDRGTRRLLGLHAVVRGGGELVQGFGLALKLGATVDDVADALYVFPSYGEAVHYAAETAGAAGPAAATGDR